MTLAVLALPAGCRRQPPPPGPSPAAAAEYYCPMHASYVANAPGDCAICGMKLVPRPTRSRRRAASASPPPVANPPGEIAGADDGAATAAAAPTSRRVPNRAPVVLPVESRRLLGVRSVPVRRLRLYRQIRALGRVAPGAPSSRVRVLAEVYEEDLPLIEVGMSAALTVLYLPGKGWTGQVVEVAPTVEARTRTITLRLEVSDPSRALRPGMFAVVFLKRDLGMGVMVPDDAVIFSGNRRVVFVDHPDGRLEPRELRLGPNVGSGYQVLSGLAEGEPVVTSAHFLIDSESNLRAALEALAGPAEAEWQGSDEAVTKDPP